MAVLVRDNDSLALALEEFQLANCLLVSDKRQLQVKSVHKITGVKDGEVMLVETLGQVLEDSLGIGDKRILWYNHPVTLGLADLYSGYVRGGAKGESSSSSRDGNILELGHLRGVRNLALHKPVQGVMGARDDHGLKRVSSSSLRTDRVKPSVFVRSLGLSNVKVVHDKHVPERRVNKNSVATHKKAIHTVLAIQP